MTVVLHSDPLEPFSLVSEHERGLAPGSFGACALFVGTMRDFNDGEIVTGMTLEHYPGMTERELALIEDDARTRWPIQDSLIGHRVGRIEPGQPIVVVAAWSAHRQAAFEACQFLMEALKERAPLWKQEALEDGGRRWVSPSPNPSHQGGEGL
ncbi:molybdenum cofactor biosynthesis protein MoaE [Ectothiorhodospira marina]|jgi:molybdopterin synthase catalytic subunit|uniref:Molybdopterin synthase catalytic subunit n=1 Tax=Ectothiorhodospira marina TaxID=1396821 RepID=A0A1H7RDC4_9GAMM|nr:molybdenum cofactor biosynthesis protein MoaE [Ectothiorhodospira marina]SEL58276.1 molybdopterin synthase catalytic subunit [Ectothiorhodospira marina]